MWRVKTLWFNSKKEHQEGSFSPLLTNITFISGEGWWDILVVAERFGLHMLFQKSFSGQVLKLCLLKFLSRRTLWIQDVIHSIIYSVSIQQTIAKTRHTLEAVLIGSGCIPCYQSQILLSVLACVWMYSMPPSYF